MEKQISIRRVPLALGCAMVLVLAGCGVTAAGGASATTAAQTATATAVASATTAAQTATASSASDGAVTLSLGAPRYAASDHIVITIHNSGGAAIYAQQHNTSCSMVLLQRLINGAWQPVFPCNNGFPHPTVGSVAPGSSFAVQLVPVVTGDAEATGIQWPAGTYRAALRYTTSQTAPFSQGTAAYSSTFAVG